jgi:enterochelin esterase-like enzyme
MPPSSKARWQCENKGVRKDLAARLHHRGDFHSHLLPGQRELTVYLPPGYESEPNQQFPVMLLHDAQNVFRAETAFVPGQYWRVGETADELIGAQKLQQIVLVGINHGGDRRIDEFTPSRNPENNYGGQANLYGRMLVEEVLPFIRHQYRVLPTARNTGLGGSSLGGLVSIYLGIQYPDVFGRLAVMSPSVWWDYRMILRKIVSLTHRHRTKMWLDVGMKEGSNPKATLRDVRLLRDVLLHKGWKSGANLYYYEDPDGFHDEAAWARRTPHMLQFLFPGKKASNELPLALDLVG